MVKVAAGITNHETALVSVVIPAKQKFKPEKLEWEKWKNNIDNIKYQSKSIKHVMVVRRQITKGTP